LYSLGFILLIVSSGLGINDLCARNVVPSMCSITNSSLKYASPTVGQELQANISDRVNISKIGDWDSFGVDRLVMLVQIQGSQYDPSNSSSYGSSGSSAVGYTSLNGVGNYDFRQITSVTDQGGSLQILFDESVKVSFSSTGINKFQIVLVLLDH
jgi:hypothetical protein